MQSCVSCAYLRPGEAKPCLRWTAQHEGVPAGANHWSTYMQDFILQTSGAGKPPCKWPRCRMVSSPETGSADEVEKHKGCSQIQCQHGNHAENHVIAVILSHFCVPRMINVTGSQQFPFQLQLHRYCFTWHAGPPSNWQCVNACREARPAMH